MRMKPLSRTLIALLLLVCMLLPLAACGQIDAPGPAPDAHGVPGSAPTSEPTPYEVPDDLPLRISEVMPSNKATIAADGLFCQRRDGAHLAQGRVPLLRDGQL